MEWQPIETAPALNGGSTKAVLVWCQRNKCVFTAIYDKEAQCWQHFGGAWDCELVEPATYWMPLPAPPKATE